MHLNYIKLLILKIICILHLCNLNFSLKFPDLSPNKTKLLPPILPLVPPSSSKVKISDTPFSKYFSKIFNPCHTKQEGEQSMLSLRFSTREEKKYTWLCNLSNVLSPIVFLIKFSYKTFQWIAIKTFVSFIFTKNIKKTCINCSIQ